MVLPQAMALGKSGCAFLMRFCTMLALSCRMGISILVRTSRAGRHLLGVSCEKEAYNIL